MVDEGNSGDEEPGQVLRQVADCEESSCCIFSVGQGGRSREHQFCACQGTQETLVRIKQVQDVNKCRNTDHHTTGLPKALIPSLTASVRYPE